MKFDYCYRTKDNVEHWGQIEAPNKESVYTLLRTKGIKPGRVVPSPGFINILIGTGKRWIAIVVLSFLLLAAVLLMVLENSPDDQVMSTLNDQTRRQLIGDTAIIEKGIQSGWADVFEFEAERFLASFAIPGVPAGVRKTSSEKLKEAIERDIAPAHGDSIEVRQIKSLVRGMKEELREFLAAGGTVEEYGSRLVGRQEEEIGYYNRANNEIKTLVESGASPREVIELWELRNGQLRKMGIRLVPLPQ